MYKNIKKQTEDSKEIEMKITYTETQEDGDKIVEYSNGSWMITNEQTNKYIFQPIEMGDWDLRFDNKKDFENCVNTYFELQERVVSPENIAI